ncbi:protein of unknown function [Candidatus Filomicrobium marinum]|uniref:Uncharacterized protein n=1 Tax=Candidatus Filomicrobium marinum TaxID=1608628 RepID=A0A0D6JCH9_9HYPH|nr:protein of unknown function [Candidatus Filomicrobium marinum]
MGTAEARPCPPDLSRLIFFQEFDLVRVRDLNVRAVVNLDPAAYSDAATL